MNREEFLDHSAELAVANVTPSMTPTEKADVLETVMIDELEVKVVTPWLAKVGQPRKKFGPAKGRQLMGEDPRLPKMPKAPTLIDFFKYRLAVTASGTNHLLQSARLAQDKGQPEPIILACLLHDISVISLIRTDHGYWGAQLVAPYVDEEVSWAIRYHQSLRYFAAPEYNYEYPAFYKEVFGEDYQVEPYIEEAMKYAKSHRWYDSAMQVVVNDFYAFDPSKEIDIEDFTDIIARNFKQPKEGLGFDNSATAHMWRTLIWPNNFL